VPLARFLGLALALLAVSAQPAFGEGRSVTRKVKIGEGASSFTVSCPKGYTALNGGTYPTISDVVTSLSAPDRGLRKWRFGFDAEGPSKVRVEVRCGGVRFRHRTRSRFQVQTSARNNVLVRAGATRKVRLKCAKGRIPTGYGQSQTLGQDREPGAIDFYSVAPSRRGFVIRLRNQSTEDSKIDLFLRCWKRTGRGQLRVKVRKFRTRIPANGRKGVKHRCRRGEFALATGWSFSPDSGVALTSTRTTGKRKARWSFDNGSDGARARTSILCLARQR
jgi:hypothetical protein